MFAIIGISGNVGGAAARALLKAGKSVRGVVRDQARAVSWAEKGVELVTADVNDAPALEKAFCGLEGVFVMAPPNFAPEKGYPETRAIVSSLRQALAAARPAKVVYLSSVGAHKKHGLGLITQSHILEQEMSSLRSSNAFIRAAWFMENYQWDAGSARERGEIDVYLSPVQREFPMVGTEEVRNILRA